MPKKNASVAAKLGLVTETTVEQPVKETPAETMSRVLLPKKPAVKKPEPITDPSLITSGLNEWYDWAGAHGTQIREAMSYFKRRNRIGNVSAGSRVVNTATGETATVIQQQNGCSTVVKTNDGQTTSWAPGTEIETVPAGSVPAVKATSVFQPGGGEIAQTTTAKKHKLDIFGSSHTKFFMWAGSKGWDVAAVKLALKNLGMPEVSELSIKTFLRAGKSDEVRIREKRGDLPVYSAEQQTKLNEAAGKVEVKTEPKVETKKGNKKTK